MNYIVLDKATKLYKRDANLQANEPLAGDEELVQCATYPDGDKRIFENVTFRTPTGPERAAIQAVQRADKIARANKDVTTATLLKLIARYTNTPLATVEKDFADGG